MQGMKALLTAAVTGSMEVVDCLPHGAAVNEVLSLLTMRRLNTPSC